ncbi:MAG: 2,3-dihydroxybenzoate-AMP ligase [Solirubrobacterales bacterium]|nr:2,3-dihydroxybenzoate-AMP ligase [Solirubrobacterales bacterium]
MSTQQLQGVVPFPVEFADRYRAAGVWGGKTIPQEFRTMARANPDALAMATPTETTTYAELDRQTDRIACGLRELGLMPGERVILQFTNTPWAVLAWYGLLKAGLVPVASLAQHRHHEIAEISRQTEPTAHLIQADFPGHDLVALARDIAKGQPSLRVVLTLNADPAPEGAVALESLLTAGPADDAEAAAIVDEIQRGIDPDSVAAMQLSGGTTSVPKVIPRLHAEYWFNAKAYAEAIELGPGRTVAHLLPVVHNAGIVCGVHAAHSTGACFGLSPHDAAGMKALARQVPLTHMMIPPPIAKHILEDPELREALGTLTSAIWVLGRLNDPVIESFETDTCRIVQMFGMGEGLCLVTARDAPVAIRHLAVGSSICDLDEIRVYEPGTETEVVAGEPGEFCCRGPYTIRGYYRSPERNAEAFTSDGFYRTGDIVRQVDDGGTSYYVLEDRIKDVINRGGEKVNAAEVEGLLIRHPAIERAALVAMPDERLGERACAFLVITAGHKAPSVSDLQEYLHGLGVAKFKTPERVEVRPDLPLTNVDKVNKVTLRREIAALLEEERAATAS